MKSKKNLLDLLNSLPHFDKNIVLQLGNQLGLKNTTIDTYISRFIENKDIFQLKKGLYVSADFFSKNKNDISYSFYLANIIRTPSYVSSWTALQYYNLTTETIHLITSVTPKITRDYRTKAGNFTYQSIQKDLFSDFSYTKGKFNSFIATPAKALFDLLYFRTGQFRGMKTENAKIMAEELRIDFDEMETEEQSKFYVIIKKYLNHE